MNPLFIVFGIKKPFEKFNANVKKYGWVQGNQKLFQDLGISIEKNFQKIPKGALLVFANHPTGLDPFLLSSILDKEDTICVCDIYQTKKGKEVKKHIIPIYYWNLTDFFWKPITAWPGFFIMRITAGRETKLKAKSKNNEAIERVLKELKSGKTVIMFPSGGEVNFRPWKAGIGKIIKEANKRKISYSLYGIHIENLSELGLILHFLTGKKYFRNKKVVLNGKPVYLPRDIIETYSSYGIAQYLKKIL